MTDIDTTELRQLVRDLRRAGAQALPAVRPCVAKGALNIKRDLQAEMSASQHFKGAARSISYEVLGNGFMSEARIGPKSGRGQAGALANIAYFGSSRGGGTVPDPQKALEREAPRFEAAILAALRALL